LLVSLPMYGTDAHPEARAEWWRGIRRHLSGDIAENAPEALTEPHDVHAHWRDPDLLLSQTCGAPLVTVLGGAVRVVGTPIYDAEGCDGVRYTSAVIVRADDPARTLADLRGRRLAINEPGSYSGSYALRAALAGIAEPRVAYFSEVIETGAHMASLLAVRDGRADCAAIDGVTLALARRDAPDIMAGVRVLVRTAPAPGLPYVTRGTATDADIEALRDAVRAAVADPALTEVRGALLIAGFEEADRSDYDAVAESIASSSDIVL